MSFKEDVINIKKNTDIMLILYLSQKLSLSKISNNETYSVIENWLEKNKGKTDEIINDFSSITEKSLNDTSFSYKKVDGINKVNDFNGSLKSNTYHDIFDVIQKMNVSYSDSYTLSLKKDPMQFSLAKKILELISKSELNNYVNDYLKQAKFKNLIINNSKFTPKQRQEKVEYFDKILSKYQTLSFNEKKSLFNESYFFKKNGEDAFNFFNQYINIGFYKNKNTNKVNSLVKLINDKGETVFQDIGEKKIFSGFGSSGVNLIFNDKNRDRDRIYLTEGLGNVFDLYKLTKEKYPICCGFNCGNLSKVVDKLYKDGYKEIVIATDLDNIDFEVNKEKQIKILKRGAGVEKLYDLINQVNEINSINENKLYLKFSLPIFKDNISNSSIIVSKYNLNKENQCKQINLKSFSDFNDIDRNDTNIVNKNINSLLNPLDLTVDNLDKISYKIILLNYWDDKLCLDENIKINNNIVDFYNNKKEIDNLTKNSSFLRFIDKCNNDDVKIKINTVKLDDFNVKNGVAEFSSKIENINNVNKNINNIERT